MTKIEISELELLQAQSQVKLLQDLLGEQIEKKTALSAAGADTSAVIAVIADIEEDIKEIEGEARKYDYLLNPRQAPQRCNQCNDGGFNPNCPPIDCPTCGNPLIKNRPPDGVTNWIIPGEAKGQALPTGEVPK